MSTTTTTTTIGRKSSRRNSLDIFRFAKRLQEKYILKTYWTNPFLGKIDDVSELADVDIGEAGCFKYVLVEVRNRNPMYERTKFVVRGDASCTYHSELYEKLVDQIDQDKLMIICRGGGRICVDPATRRISVYGYSPDYGQADHQKTVEILRKKYPQWIVETKDQEY